MLEPDFDPDEMAAILRAHRAVDSVRLTGSRARGDATEESDWDYLVTTHDFKSVADSLKTLLAPFDPLAAQWDRLSNFECYMVIINGPAKVDFIFDGIPHSPLGPWEVTSTTLEAIDEHFWDWISG